MNSLYKVVSNWTWQTYCVLISGILSILFTNALINNYKHRNVVHVYKEVLTMSTLIAVIVTCSAAFQVECMVKGGCIMSSWIQTAVLVLACAIYMFTVRKLILDASKTDTEFKNIKLNPIQTPNSALLDKVVTSINE